MDIEIDRLTDVVALMLGEYPDWRSLKENGGSARDLSEMVEKLAEPVALAISDSTPLEDFTSPIDIRTFIYDNADWGEGEFGEVELPEDFMRLHSLRMSDWPSPLTEHDLNRENIVNNRGNHLPEWLLLRLRRPRIELSALGDTRILRFGPTNSRFPVVANYIARPRYDYPHRELLNIDPTLLLPLARRIAEEINRKL